MTNQTTVAKDRVRLPISFDVSKLRADVQALDLDDFIHYNVLPLRAPAHLVDPSAKPPPPAEDYADGSWTDWLDTRALRESQYLSTVVNTFRQHTNVTLVRLLRLEAGGIINEHTDPTLGLEIPKSVIRLTIPIFSDETVSFYLNDQVVPMKPGECWYLRLCDPHRIDNTGDVERINMTIDMIPNEWVRSMILDNQ